MSIHRNIPCFVGVVIFLLSFTGCKTGITEASQESVKWRVFNSANSAVKRNHIPAIYTDHGNRVWIGTDSGAYMYKNRYWTPYIDQVSLLLRIDTIIYIDTIIVGRDTSFSLDSVFTPVKASMVTSIAESNDGSVWFGQQVGGIVRYKQPSVYPAWRRYSTPPLPYDAITSVAAQEISGGDVWIGTRLGLVRLTGINSSATEDSSRETWNILTPSNSAIPGIYISTIAVNPYNSVMWIGTYSNGIVSYDPASGEWFRYNLNYGSNPHVNAIAFENAGTAWCATSLGIYSVEISTNVQQYYDYSNTGKVIPRSRITSAASYGGTKWFGSDSGLVCLKNTVWSRWTTKNSSLPDNHITALNFDLSGNLWIGTLYGGVAEYNENGIK
jgi:ligand-binding sensor domain-containing protein